MNSKLNSVSIAGSSGFIGRKLSAALQEQYNITKISLRSKSWQDEITNSTGGIINLVGLAHDHNGLATEQDYYYTNYELVKELFSCFLKSQSPLLIHISSLAAVEEFDRDEDITETSFCRPESWYGKSKRAAEEWLLSQALPEDKKVLIIRPPMVHGPGDKGNLGLLFKIISKGFPYPLSAFDNKRSFISIHNFCFFIDQMLVKHQSLKSGLLHVADDEQLSTLEIIKIIKTLLDKNTLNLPLPKGVVRFLATIGDMFNLGFNTKRLRKMTGNLIVSNHKAKEMLNLNRLPLTAKEGVKITLQSFLETQH